MQFVALFCRAKHFRVVAANGVEVRCEEDAVTRLAKRLEADNQIIALRRDRLTLNVESGPGGALDQIVGDFGLPGASIARWQKGGIDAGQRDQVTQELNNLAHHGRSNVSRSLGQSRRWCLAVRR